MGMDDMQPDRNASRRNRNSAALSASIHIGALIALTGILHRAPKFAPYILPGTGAGTQLLTYYSPGSKQPGRSIVPVKAADKQKQPSTVHRLTAPEPEPAAAPSADRGIASSGQSGLGDGNITIALQKYFPYPKPSLATLPHGAAGDVILNAVIDEHGKIAELTLLQGLGPAIDDEVIQTVDQWIYTPATKDGVPVPSIQELHFHYERRG
jgi:periplasmic protein TonB